MAGEDPDYDRFFLDYVDGFNRALAGGADFKAMQACYAEHFIAAGAHQLIVPGINDGSYTRMLKKGMAFYRDLGTRSMNFRKVAVTPIDADHDMVRVYFFAEYGKQDGDGISIDFDVIYLLQKRADGPKIFAFIAGDEMAIYRQHGLIDESGNPVAAKSSRKATART